MTEQRQAVLDSARYLRQVRPLDPAELREYVPGRPHPGVVRRVLRETATTLDVVERPDGTFVPVDEGAVSVDFDGVTGLPAVYGRRLADRLRDHLGPDWQDGEAGDRLRSRIRGFKSRYLHDEPVSYDALTALGYAVYHLPATYAAVQYALAPLARADLLPTRIRVLDVGAGVGGPALGVVDLLPEDALIEYHAVEPSAAADLLEVLLGETGRNVHPTVHRETAEAFDPDGDADLLLFSNVLSELDAPADVLADYLDALAHDGTCLALAPADRQTATGLRTVERAVADERDLATVYAPTLRLWPAASPAGDCWSFTREPDIETPAVQRRLDEGTRATPDDRPPGDGEFVNTDVQYAYSVLRPDGRRRVGVDPDPASHARLGDADSLVTERVDCLGVKLSPDLGTDNALFLVGDGSEDTDHFAVLTESSVLNRRLVDAPYGTVLAFENVLVLWNDDEAAYNLVVGAETVVDVVG